QRCPGDTTSSMSRALTRQHRQIREDDELDYVWLSSDVTPECGMSHGMGHSGEGVLATAGEEAVAVG
ncbi:MULTISPECIES: hypothetical protein, partial [Gordonia]|uniref:hypothetical protein n=1 Tax=Gordonia TaxID=2053 RepID=UPI001C8F2292